MKTTTVGAIGMEVPAVAQQPPQTMAMSEPFFARHANAWTRKQIRGTPTAQGVVHSRITKGMADVTTKTIIAAANMMAVIAVLEPS